MGGLRRRSALTERRPYPQPAESRAGYGGVRWRRWRAKAALGESVYPLLRDPSFSGIEVTTGSARVRVR